MKLLMIGDIVGKPGRQAVARLLPGLRREFGVDVVIANGENTAGGRGLTPQTADELYAAGVDVITSGNHIWDQREIYPALDSDTTLLRPVNYPPTVPGRGYCLHHNLLVINAIGRSFMGEFDDPFRAVDAVLEELGARTRLVFVDFHAETTSEKAAMGWHLDGRVSVLVGTHTHVPTADQRILPGGTAFVSDVGMVGGLNSVIGFEPDSIVERFRNQLPARFTVQENGPVRFNSVLIDVDEASGRARSIERVDRTVEPK